MSICFIVLVFGLLSGFTLLSGREQLEMANLNLRYRPVALPGSYRKKPYPTNLSQELCSSSHERTVSSRMCVLPHEFFLR